MPFRLVDPASVSAEPGPHPAASPFDKRVSEALGISAFEIYRVDLPPRAETVRHDHLDDRVEDAYVFLRGSGWVIVDDEHVPVEAGQVIAVTIESTRQVRAADDGMSFMAICAASKDVDAR